jgi:hypothetical protein
MGETEASEMVNGIDVWPLLPSVTATPATLMVGLAPIAAEAGVAAMVAPAPIRRSAAIGARQRLTEPRSVGRWALVGVESFKRIMARVWLPEMDHPPNAFTLRLKNRRKNLRRQRTSRPITTFRPRAWSVPPNLERRRQRSDEQESYAAAQL